MLVLRIPPIFLCYNSLLNVIYIGDRTAFGCFHVLLFCMQALITMVMAFQVVYFTFMYIQGQNAVALGLTA